MSVFVLVGALRDRGLSSRTQADNRRDSLVGKEAMQVAVAPPAGLGRPTEVFHRVLLSAEKIMENLST